MDYGLCIGTMRSFAAAKTSGPALRIGTGSTNEKKTGISVDAVSSLIYSTSQYKFIATYVGYSFQAQGVRKNQSFFFVFFSSSSSHPVFYSPWTPSYFILLLLHHIFFFNKFFSFFSFLHILTPCPLPAILIHLIFPLTLHSSLINVPLIVLLFALHLSFLFHVFFSSSSPILPFLYPFFLLSLQCSEQLCIQVLKLFRPML